MVRDREHDYPPCWWPLARKAAELCTPVRTSCTHGCRTCQGGKILRLLSIQLPCETALSAEAESSQYRWGDFYSQGPGDQPDLENAEPHEPESQNQRGGFGKLHHHVPDKSCADQAHVESGFSKNLGSLQAHHPKCGDWPSQGSRRLHSGPASCQTARRCGCERISLAACPFTPGFRGCAGDEGRR